MEQSSNPHHLVMGQMTDILTGQTISDTHDERYRQKIASLLLERCQFKKEQISSNVIHTVTAGSNKANLKIDFLVSLYDHIVVMIKYAPGSIVTRRLSTLALSRIIAPYQVPFAVITNGEDAEIIDGTTGNILGRGLAALPEQKNVTQLFSTFSFHPISKSVFEQAGRIAYACEVDGACPCDTEVCILE